MVVAVVNILLKVGVIKGSDVLLTINDVASKVSSSFRFIPLLLIDLVVRMLLE